MVITSEQTLKEAVTDFLASGPSGHTIIAYHLPEILRERAAYTSAEHLLIIYAKRISNLACE